MSVASVSSSPSGLAAIQSRLRQLSPVPADGPAASAGPAAEARVSRRGQFLNKLQELAKTDPAQAKQLVTDLAAKLRSEAKDGDPHGARRLALADRLEKAAASGDYSSLEAPPKSPAGGSAVRGYQQVAATTWSSR